MMVIIMILVGSDYEAISAASHLLLPHTPIPALFVPPVTWFGRFRFHDRRLSGSSHITSRIKRDSILAWVLVNVFTDRAMVDWTSRREERRLVTLRLRPTRSHFTSYPRRRQRQNVPGQVAAACAAVIPPLSSPNFVPTPRPITWTKARLI